MFFDDDGIFLDPSEVDKGDDALVNKVTLLLPRDRTVEEGARIVTIAVN